MLANVGVHLNQLNKNIIKRIKIRTIEGGKAKHFKNEVKNDNKDKYLKYFFNDYNIEICIESRRILPFKTLNYFKN